MRPIRSEQAPGSSETSKRKQRLRQMEILATILLSAATVLTAWSAFQSSKWSGLQAIRFSQASASRAESIRFSTQAGQQAITDAALFTAWLTATDQGEKHLAGLLEARFRGELSVAFQAWEATSPLTNASAAASPLDMPEYQSTASKQATNLAALATRQFHEATDANQQSDDYVLMTVLFAMVLFFGAVSTRFDLIAIRSVLLGLGAAVFFAAVATTATFPIQI